MMAIVSPFSLSSDFSRMHDLRQLKITNKNINRLSAEVERLNRTLSPRDLNIPNSLKSPKSDKITRNKHLLGSNVCLQLEESRRSLHEVSVSKREPSKSYPPQFTSLPISVTDCSSNSDSYHTANSEISVSSKIKVQKRRLRSAEIKTPSLKKQRVSEVERLLTEFSIHGKPDVNILREDPPKTKINKSSSTSSTLRSGIRASSQLLAKYPYQQPLFNNSSIQPLFENKTESFIESKLFALENAEEFNQACIRQSTIEVPSWRVLDTKQIESKFDEIQKRKARIISNKSNRNINSQALEDEKEDISNNTYDLRHTKHELQEIKREKRCVQLQLEHDRRAHLEARDRRAWERRRPFIAKIASDTMPSGANLGRQNSSSVQINPTSLGTSITHISEDVALRNTPKQLTLSPLNSIHVTKNIPVTAFGTIVPAPEHKRFPQNEPMR